MVGGGCGHAAGAAGGGCVRPVKPLKVKSFETKMVWLPLDKEEFSLKKVFFLKLIPKL